MELQTIVIMLLLVLPIKYLINFFSKKITKLNSYLIEIKLNKKHKDILSKSENPTREGVIHVEEIIFLNNNTEYLTSFLIVKSIMYSISTYFNIKFSLLEKEFLILRINTQTNLSIFDFYKYIVPIFIFEIKKEGFTPNLTRWRVEEKSKIKKEKLSEIIASYKDTDYEKYHDFIKSLLMNDIMNDINNQAH